MILEINFLQLFSHLIRVLVKACPLKKVVLLGDVSQLPSIAPGNFMTDLFRSLRQESFVVELRTNHRSESSLIFNNAHRICQGKMPLFDRYNAHTNCFFGIGYISNKLKYPNDCMIHRVFSSNFF